jgi:molybdenum cofactor cytidylyltransferase
LNDPPPATPVVSPAPRKRVAAIVLAAGRSSRTSPQNKLLATGGGPPLITRIVAAALDSPLCGVVVVTGHQRAELERALGGMPRGVRFVFNPGYANGVSSSIAAGIGALGPDIDAAIVCLGDMPEIRPSHVAALIEAFETSDGRAVCVPHYQGQRGNPVLWPACDFTRLQQLRGDIGGRQLLGCCGDRLRRVDMADDAILNDVDTPEALAAHAARVDPIQKPKRPE